ncbi:unnamed protein product, partial [Merluccius merluccius]
MATYQVSSKWTDENNQSLLKLLDESRTENLIQHLEKSLRDEEIKSIDTIFDEIRQMKDIDEQTLSKSYSVVTHVTNLIKTRKWWPRPTQMISWCLLALSDTGKLLEMGTGEGKSCVIAMFAVLRALRGEKVDVVSSSSVLCQRDAEEWTNFYKYFGMTADTNTNKTEDKDRKECYQKDVVYGTIEAFAADHLRQIFEMKDVRPDRSYQCIIIDEVDSLLLDQGRAVLCVSDQTQQHICIGSRENEERGETEERGGEEKRRGETEERGGEEKRRGETEERGGEKRRGAKDDSKTDELGKILSVLDKLLFDEWISAPPSLSTLQHTQNAFLAKQLKEGQEYVVENDNVCPVDFRSTGIVELNKKWGDGLQQFVEIKHQIKLSTISIVTNYVSNISFFEKYHGKIYGTTGTLGSKTDILLLQDLYPNLSACKMPSSNRKKLFEVKGTLKTSAEEWKSEIKRVNNNGGLFVILSFLSENTRVELQAFGRTARKGKPGSAQVIMSTEYLQQSFRTVSSLEEAKSTRDRLAAEKINYMMNDVTELKLREDLFSEYCKTLQDIYKNTDGDDKRAVVAIMNEFWGIWLQTKSEEIDQLKRNELENSLKEDLSLAKSQSQSQTSPCSSIYHYIKFGNIALSEKRWDDSTRLFQKAIEQDESWAAIAFYSHAYCTIKQKNADYLAKARDDLRKAQESLKYLSEESMVCLQLVKMFSANSANSNPTSLEKQFITKCSMFSYFDKNISEAIQKLDEIKERGRGAMAKKSPIFSLVSSTDEDLQAEAYNLYSRGLQYVFTVEEEPRFPWEALLVLMGPSPESTGDSLTQGPSARSWGLTQGPSSRSRGLTQGPSARSRGLTQGPSARSRGLTQGPS